MFQLAQALINLHGQVGILAQDGHFLGVFSSNAYDANSLLNSQTYGNRHEETIFNKHSIYGGKNGLYSPYNPNCLNPPILVSESQQLALITRNQRVLTNGLEVIDPDFLLGVLYAIASGQSHRQSDEQLLLELYTQAAMESQRNAAQMYSGRF